MKYAIDIFHECFINVMLLSKNNVVIIHSSRFSSQNILYEVQKLQSNKLKSI